MGINLIGNKPGNPHTPEGDGHDAQSNPPSPSGTITTPGLPPRAAAYLVLQILADARFTLDQQLGILAIAQAELAYAIGGRQ